MPRIVVQSPALAPTHGRLVKRLAQEIKSPGTMPQPLILEEEIKATRTRHVRVIWDEWKRIIDEERADIILAAYEQAEGGDFVETITTASGHTAKEAMALGLLPWKVEPNLVNGKPAEYGRALLEEEKNTLLGRDSISQHGALRYARREDAKAALDRLKRSHPNVAWTLAQEVFPEA